MRLTFPTLLVLALLALPSLLLAQVQQHTWKTAMQQDGIIISNQAALSADDNIMLVKEESGAKAGIPSFHVQVDAHSAKVMDCQELGPHGMMPVFVENEADITITTSHLHVGLL